MQPTILLARFYLSFAISLGTMFFAQPAIAQYPGTPPVLAVEDPSMPRGKPIINGKTVGEDNLPVDPNSCLFNLGTAPVALFVGGQFLAGEGLEPHKRFDSFLRGQFSMKYPYAIEARKEMTSKVLKESLNQLLSKHRPNVIVLDTAINDLQAGISRADSFFNLSTILHELSKYQLEIILIEGPAREEINTGVAADPLYSVLASQYNTKFITGVYTYLSSSQSYINKSTPALEAQFHFAKAYKGLMQKCYPQKQAN